jgi:RimJ/RimL family protein N-acetyltransferase
MLQLARLTNSRIYFHPLTIAVWLACLAVLVHVSGVLARGDWSRFGLFTASMTSGFLLTGEFLTRNRFEAKATDLLQNDPSLQDFSNFYGKDKFFVATLGENMVIGLIGIQIDGKVATVKHWHVKATYRNRGLGWDLVEAVLERNKSEKKGGVGKVKIDTYNLQKRAEKSLKSHGFQLTGKEVTEPGILGIFGIKSRTWEKTL